MAWLKYSFFTLSLFLIEPFYMAAIGKDYPPSGTGYQFSLPGVFAGPALKLPGTGRPGMDAASCN